MRPHTYPSQRSSTQGAIEGPFEPGEFVFLRGLVDPPKGGGGGRVDWVHILHGIIR